VLGMGEKKLGARVLRRDLLTTMAGIGAGQLILLAAMPFLARAFGPAAFGHYSVIVAIAGVLATISALRLDLAVTSAADRDVDALARAALVLPVVVGPAGVLLLWLATRLPISRDWSFGHYDLTVIAAIAAAQGMVLGASGLSTRLGNFGTLAAIKIFQPLVFAGLALTILPNLPLAMAAGWIASLAAAIPVLDRVPIRSGWRRTWDAALRSWRFVAISAPVALLDVLALALPLLFIAAAYGSSDAGNYSQVQRLIGAPLTLVATACAQVFFKHAGDRFRRGEELLPLFRRVSAGMAVLAVLALVAVLLIGHPLLSFLMGPSWRTDTAFLVLSLCPVLFRVVASPVSSTLIVTGRLGTIGVWQATYCAVTLATLSMAKYWLGFEQMLFVYACSEFVMYVLYLVLSYRAAARFSGAGTPTGSLSALPSGELKPLIAESICAGS